MGSRLDEDPNYGSSQAFPLVGTELKASQHGFFPTHGSYPLSPAAPQQNYLPSQVNSATASPITAQPKSQGQGPNSDWMSTPPTVPNCPPGLEYLTILDHLIVKKEPVEMTWIKKNKFVVSNFREEKVYSASQAFECCTSRACEIKIMDNFGNEVISMISPMTWCSTSLEISSPPGCMVGVVEQEWSFFNPSFLIKNSVGDIVLRIKGPRCGTDCCADINFMILSADGSTEIGRVYWKYLGYANLPYNNTLGVQFPMDMDVTMKAIVLGACFLIGMLYFRFSGNK